MTDQDSKLIIQDIINKAQGPAQPFRPILYWSEYRYYQRVQLSNKLIIRALWSSAESLFTEYCHNVVTGTQDVSKLFAYSQLLDIKAFYERDLDTVKRMLDDYTTYILEGNFFYSLFGGRRDL